MSRRCEQPNMTTLLDEAQQVAAEADVVFLKAMTAWKRQDLKEHKRLAAVHKELAARYMMLRRQITNATLQ